MKYIYKCWLSPSPPRAPAGGGSSSHELTNLKHIFKGWPQVDASERFVIATTILILTSGNYPDCFMDTLTLFESIWSSVFRNPPDFDCLLWLVTPSSIAFPLLVWIIRAALRQRFTDGSATAYPVFETNIPEGQLSYWAVNRRKDGSMSVPISMVGKALASSCSSPAAEGEETQRLNSVFTLRACVYGPFYFRLYQWHFQLTPPKAGGREFWCWNPTLQEI